jgi:uncharacterized protein (DUF2342 family)
MLTQLGQMLSQAQSSGGGPVNYDLAAQLATSAGRHHLVVDGQASAPR